MEAGSSPKSAMFHRRLLDPILFRQARFLFVVSAITGCAPVLVVGGGQFKLSYLLVLYSAFIYFGFLYLTFAIQETIITCSSNPVVDILVLSLRPVYSTMFLVSVLAWCINHGKINQMLDALRSIDEALKQITVTKAQPRFWPDRCFQIILLVLYVVSLAIFFNDWIPVVYFFVGTASYVLLCLQFLFFGMYISNIFQSAINCICVLSCKDRRRKEKLTKNLSRIHSQLCRSLEAFYFCYSVQYIVATLFLLIFSILRIYCVWFESNISPVVHIIKSCFILYHWVPFLRVIDCSEKITKQTQQFNILLYQQMIYDNSNEILNSEYLKLHIAMQEEVTFTACGFFNMDYALVQSMVSVVATYFVILIQFGDSEPASTG